MKRAKIVREINQIIGLLPSNPHMAKKRLEWLQVMIQEKPTLINRIINKLKS